LTTRPDAPWLKANLGLGGNIGDPAAQMARALAMIDKRLDCRVLQASKLYRTPPWGKTDQDWFFNACAQIETSLAPEDLLDLCLEIERSMNRVRVERWGPRTLDIDILTFEGVHQDDVHLHLPHPRIAERAFVLLPLSDYAPELAFAGRTVSELLETMDITAIEAVSTNGNWWRQGKYNG
jgi:2-amino-4-hydroxy-6-hydroxymethyldihydropteridine diphosphokinase